MEFANFYNDRLAMRTVHLAHDADPVLAQNAPLWKALGYAHTGRVVQCSAAEPRLLEEANDASSTIAWNFAQHCQYLGTYLGPRIRPPKLGVLKPRFVPR